MRRRLDMLRREEGFTIIEMLAAAIVLAVGVAAMVTVFSASGKLTQVAERSTSEAHRASLELERIKSLPWGQVAMTGTSSQWSTTAGDYTYVSGLGGSCPASPSGAAPQYQPDHSQGGSTSTESLVINGCSYTLAGNSTDITSGTVAPVTAWTDGNYSGYVYDFITWVNDPTCSQTVTAGSACPTTNDYKRVTIVVTMCAGSVPTPGCTPVTEPSHPAIVSDVLPNPNQNSSSNPNPTSNCTNSQGATGSCSTTPGTPWGPLPLCDSSYSNSSCATPVCAGNALHQTVFRWLSGAPVPDLLGATLPTGECLGAGTPTPPCYGTDILSTNCQGLPIVPTTPCTGTGCSTGTGSNGQGGCTENCGGVQSNAACGTGPASGDNSKSHAWLTQPFTSSLNLTGAGSLTAYLESGSGVAINATLCLGVYVVPNAALQTLSGSLLSISTRIGVVVAANVAAQAGFPSPVSFSFNLGTADSIAANQLGNRVEVVLWIASSASTDVQIAYDQTEAVSSVTLVEN